MTSHSLPNLVPAPPRGQSAHDAVQSLDGLRSIPGIHQFSAVTAFDRYPTLFTALAGRIRPRRLLSFGCSTGEECATARTYWPNAEVVGVDVNEESLAAARCRVPGVRFLQARLLPDLGRFDLVLALSVLCRHRDTKDQTDISAIYPFQMFAEAVGRLVAAVASRGVLVVVNANYRFEDTTHATDFRPLVDETFTDEVHHARVRRFGPDGHLLREQSGPAAFVRTAPTLLESSVP
jgi:hypothetical protein